MAAALLFTSSGGRKSGRFLEPGLLERGSEWSGTLMCMKTIENMLNTIEQSEVNWHIVEMAQSGRE